MSWIQRYHLRLYFHNSIWILPALSIPVALVTVSQLTRYERAVGSHINISTETARAIMSMVAASTFTLVVLVASAVLVAVQLASAQLTPRVIALVYRNPYRKVAFSIFVLTFTFAVGVLVRIEDTVPRLAGSCSRLWVSLQPRAFHHVHRQHGKDAASELGGALGWLSWT